MLACTLPYNNFFYVFTYYCNKLFIILIYSIPQGIYRFDIAHVHRGEEICAIILAGVDKTSFLT